MNYYSHNVGDYRRDTGHLSLLEHGIYRHLLDTYYLDEKPLPLDDAKLMRTHSVRTAEEIQALKNILSDFFVRTDEGYTHKRCDVEIEAFHTKSSSASESAKARWERVRAEKDANAMRTHSEGNANHKPITNNQVINISKKPRKERETQIPSDFCVTEELRRWAEGKGIMNIDAHLDPFIMACKAKGYAYVDWSCAFQKAVRDDWAKIGHGKQQQRRFVPA